MDEKIPYKARNPGGGRKKLKPEYTAGTNLKEQMDAAVTRYKDGMTPVSYTHLEVSGDKIEAVHMIPGWTHNIINLSETENLVTVMTCNEIFDPNHPDTFFEPV